VCTLRKPDAAPDHSKAEAALGFQAVVARRLAPNAATITPRTIP